VSDGGNVSGIAPLDFSLLIAFLLPGFVSLYALAYISPHIARLVNALAQGDASLGTSLGVFLLSLAVGVMISCVRAQILDTLQFKTGVEKPDLNMERLKDANVRAAYEQAVSNVYRFSQFYGNMFVSVAGLIVLKFGVDSNLISKQWELFVLMFAAAVILFISHRRGLAETYKTISKILS